TARAARDRVLDRMTGAGTLQGPEAQAALFDPVPAQRRDFPALAPHLSDRARALDPLTTRHHLTLDAGLQSRLETLARNALRDLPPSVSLAMLVADHQTGALLGAVGSASYASGDAHQGYVDMTQALRSPGSTLKPLIYAMGFDRGLAHPQTLIADRPVAFGRYAPQNFDGQFRGEVTIAEALRQSLNIPVVLLLDEIGPAHLMSAMRQSGMRPALPGDQPGLAVGLGGVGVSLMDLTRL
ncbi:MAG TPA: penicillin-binding protein 1C, partial [Roseovarius nubinhibens]|nr:penicillin-binding protein 1C [Roseovarius nubinhibens]